MFESIYLYDNCKKSEVNIIATFFIKKKRRTFPGKQHVLNFVSSDQHSFYPEHILFILKRKGGKAKCKKIEYEKVEYEKVEW